MVVGYLEANVAAGRRAVRHGYKVVQISTASSVLEGNALVLLPVECVSRLSSSASSSVDREKTELLRTGPHALWLGLEIVLVAPLSIVLERDTLPIVGIVIPSLQNALTGSGSQRYRAGISGARTADGRLGRRTDMAPEVDWARVLVSARAEEHLSCGSNCWLSDARIVEGLA
ncbi:hypothetical protein PFISCL1PPCAC_3649, partial [Pristionchus fissidentatus]